MHNIRYNRKRNYSIWDNTHDSGFQYLSTSLGQCLNLPFEYWIYVQSHVFTQYSITIFFNLRAPLKLNLKLAKILKYQNTALCLFLHFLCMHKIKPVALYQKSCHWIKKVIGFLVSLRGTHRLINLCKMLCLHEKQRICDSKNALANIIIQ